MKVERLLQFSVAVLVTLGAMLLGIGQQGTTILPVLATLAAFSSVYITDIYRFFSLNRNLANIAALCAVAFSVSDFFSGGSVDKLHAIAKLLIYLQIVLLFQTKTTRVYWHLSVLSLLQVVVAAALNMNVSFGIMLVAYMFAALTTLSLFFIYRETVRVNPQLKAEHDALDQPPIFTLSFFSSQTRNGTSHGKEAIALQSYLPGNLSKVFTGRQMFLQVCRMSFVTALTTVAVFYTLPRLDNNSISKAFPIGKNQTGFSERISLDQMGQILQSNELVMRVSYSDKDDGNLLELLYEPYFRGAVLNTYNGNGEWVTGGTHDDFNESPKPPPPGVSVVRETIIPSPVAHFITSSSGHSGDSLVLFGGSPIYQDDKTTPELKVTRRYSYITYSDGSKKTETPPHQYNMLVPSSNGPLLGAWAPIPESVADQDRFWGYLYRHLTVLKDNRSEFFSEFKALMDQTDQIVVESGVDSTDSYRIAKTLEKHFVLDGGYTYSLTNYNRTLGSEHDDPIVDFVINHRTGHCEYFASALTLMLRHKGIPARIVVGYKGGEFNSVGKFFTVKQLHAHAWVEAYIQPEDLPDSIINAVDYPKGAWLRLDPTPASRVSPGNLNKNREGIVNSALQWFDYLEAMWREYVVEMSSDRQQKEIYKPFSERFFEPIAHWFDKEKWTEFLNKNLVTLGIQMDSKWFSWYASGLAIVASFVLILLFKLTRWICRKLWVYLKPKWKNFWTPGHSRVAFYHQLEQMLSRKGWKREKGQTPQELMVFVEQNVAETENASQISSILSSVVKTYYQVRFGGVQLNESQRTEIGNQLNQLQGMLVQI
ncbi:MAG: transglutaminase TgpA family protein [Pirellulales bacterium]